jgi:PiT family inorganic phosphate transporter
MEIIVLILCLGVVLAFEFINGMNDTANAIAPVIYSHSLHPKKSVLIAACLNFLWVMFGGIAVAMSILHLLPVNEILNSPMQIGVFLVISILLSSIIWDLGAWWFALPVSSSHALIGSIIGVSIAFSLTSFGAGVVTHWNKAIEVIEWLLLSPILGFWMALLLMMIARHWVHARRYFNTPSHKSDHPSLDMRMLLIFSSALVSFMHGKNDGQKWVGIATLILMILMPATFMLNPSADVKWIATNTEIIATIFSKERPSLTHEEQKNADILLLQTQKIKNLVQDGVLTIEEKKLYRVELDSLRSAAKTFDTTTNTSLLTTRSHIDALIATTDYVPWWIIVLVSVSIGSGTLVGWKRIVKTIGEKIGNYQMNYAQAASSAIVTAGMIGVASTLWLPVSTTHVMSSSVAGTMVEEHGWRKGVDPATMKHILLAWVLTMPTTMLIAGSIFYICSKLFF